MVPNVVMHLYITSTIQSCSITYWIVHALFDYFKANFSHKDRIRKSVIYFVALCIKEKICAPKHYPKHKS